MESKKPHSYYINSQRSMAIQAIKRAGIGHAGMAISAAPITYTLFTKHINISKKSPKWFNRDRFVQSNGHGSMAVYPILCFSKMLSLDEIKNHKRKGSQTPGHPEYEPDNHIDASTGPLGQGAAMGVGMAIAQDYLSKKFAPIKELLAHKTYVMVGDGDLQEGICYEAMSIAGRLQLKDLIFVHDSNSIQLESKVSDVFNDNIKQRVEAMGWKYLSSSNKVEAIDKAINEAKKSKSPTFIEIKTIIAEGLTAANTTKGHGPAITDEEFVNFEKHFGIKPHDFEFSKDVYNHYEKEVNDRGAKAYQEWHELLNDCMEKEPDLTLKLLEWFKGKFSDKDLLDMDIITKGDQAIRTYLGTYFKELDKPKFDWIFNGSADLASSVKNAISTKFFNEDHVNHEMRYGIREHAMAGIQNGMLLHGGIRSVCSTFLVFSDYMKPSIRLGAIMHLPNIHVFSHDSYCVGGDGPTHQPIDQLPMLRAIPHYEVHRACDQYELVWALNYAFKSNNTGHAIVTTRQNVNSFEPRSFDKIAKGGYVLKEGKDYCLVASGSEVTLAMEAANKYEEVNPAKSVKVVSVPTLTKFLEQDPHYVIDVLSSRFSQVVCIEASSDRSWFALSKFGVKVRHIGAFDFGLSMDGPQLYKDRGFNVENVIKTMESK